MKKQSGVRQFGRTRIIVICWLVFLLICSSDVQPMMSFLVLLCIFYMIAMDKINGKFMKTDFEKEYEDLPPLSRPEAEPAEQKPASAKPAKAKKGKKPAKEEETVTFKDPVKCPFCGKEVPYEVKYCFYCGKSLETFRKIEAIRRDSVERLDKAAAGIDKESAKTGVIAIQDLTDKILRKYQEKSETSSDYVKFTEYYLPKSITAIEHYNVLCGLEGLDNSKLEVKDQLENSIDMIKEAFTNIYIRLSTEGIYDLSADVSALEKGLQLDGLTDSDFKV